MAEENILKQRFKVGREIRATPAINLWHGVDQKQDKPCLIKRLRYNSQPHRLSLMQMEQEAEQLRFSYHPQLSRLLAFWEQQENGEQMIYAVIDYGAGNSLHHWLKQGKNFTEKEVAGWLREVPKALNHLHTLEPAILYGDLLPENLLITTDNQVQLLHFGPLRESLFNLAHRPDLAVFCAPEQLQLKPEPASDWFSLAQLARYALERKLPKQELSEHVRGPYSADMHELLLQMLASEPAKRLQTLDALQTYMAGKSLFTKGSGPLSLEPERPHSKPSLLSANSSNPVSQTAEQGSVSKLVGLGILGVVVIITGFAFGGFFSGDEHSHLDNIPAPRRSPLASLEPVDEIVDVNLYAQFSYTESAKPMGLEATLTPFSWSNKPTDTLKGEPKYSGQVRYGLLDLGTGPRSKINLALDIDTLYVDKDRNLDLSNDPPVKADDKGQFVTSIEIDITGAEGLVAEPFRFGLIPAAEPGIFTACHYVGEVTLSQQKYPAISYIQEQNNGMFNNAGLWIDLDRNDMLAPSEHIQHQQVIHLNGKKIRLQLLDP